MAACTQARSGLRLECLEARLHHRPAAGPRGSKAPADRGAWIAFLSAATGKAFTTVLAGFALTTVSLPNIMRLPAFVAGFTRVFTVHTPGTTNFPAFFTCAWATSAKTPRIFEHSDFLRPVSVASASAMAPLVMLAAFMVFIAFMGAILSDDWGRA